MIINKTGINNFVKRRAPQAEEVGEMYTDIQELTNDFPFPELQDVCDTIQYLQLSGVKEISLEIPEYIDLTSQHGRIIYHHQSEDGDILLYVDANLEIIYFDLPSALTQRIPSQIETYIRHIFNCKQKPTRIYYNFLRSAQDRGLTEAATLELLTTATEEIYNFIDHIAEVANMLR